MRPRGDIERVIYATAYAIAWHARVSAGYPQAWREADRLRDIPAGDAERLAEWELWCAQLAVDSATAAVEMHRAARKAA